MTSPKENVHVALASNHRYVPGLKATIASMLSSANRRDSIRFHVFSDGLTDADKAEIDELVKRFGYSRSIDYRVPDMSMIEKRFKPYHESYTPYLRLFFPEIFSDLDWILWTDADVLWFRDVAKLWEERDDSVSLVWARDMVNGQKRAEKDFARWNSVHDASRFACSCIVLMNLRRLREMKLSDKCFEFERRWGTPAYPDQDMLNEICYDESKLVDNRWGCAQPDANWKDGAVLHCLGIASLFQSGFVGWHPANDIWIRYYNSISKTQLPPPPMYKRIVWYVCGLFYPPEWLAAIPSFPICKCLNVHSLRRVMFICWLRRKKLGPSVSKARTCQPTCL